MISKDVLSLEDWGLKDIELRPYQLEGVEWYVKCIRRGHGGVLADEMGLGKTIQTICAILSFKNLFNFTKFVIISPLSVIENWQSELSRFAPNLKFVVYMGNKKARSDLRSTNEWDSDEVIVLTTYEYLINDFETINNLKLDVLFMDEGHRIKNKNSVLYQKVIEMSVGYRFLLTGTPIQNNLDELYSVLYAVSPQHAMLKNRLTFKRNLESKLSAAVLDSSFDSILEIDKELSELILRRTKANVLQHLPDKMEVIIFHGLTELQKKLYKSFLAREKDIFKDAECEKKQESKLDNTKLLNVLMQIRKCVLHPYLFSGIEKEPFQLGEHIVENSVKMQAIDKLLHYLIPLGHKILLFSQMTKMLDIIQDYCFLRGLQYERLDGSVRSEERFAAISNFSQNKSTKLFLLSTRAGGQGLNLTAADTVIFVDSDFNPQVDLQAMARIHRPGQERPCRTIRLVARHSVEEMIISRAQTKLVMTRTILGHEDSKENGAPMKVKEMLCYGLDKLFSDNSNAQSPDLSNDFFTSILGKTDANGHWQTPTSQPLPKDVTNIDSMEHIYLFEGCNYKAKTNANDYNAAANLAMTADSDLPLTGKDALRSSIRPKVNLKPKEDRQDIINKAMQRKKQMWMDNNYESCNVVLESEDDDEGSETRSTSSQDLAIHYVVGDVTDPGGDSSKPKIICQLTDNSGFWGSGGVFSSIDRINPDIAVSYLRAAEMDDLSIGDTHIYRLTDNAEVALLVAQSRDKNGRLSAVRMNSLEKSIRKLRAYANQTNASIHMPRLGYKTPNFNWYGVEKLINKHLAEKGSETYVYYYRRSNKRSPSPSLSRSRESSKMPRVVDKCPKKLSEEFFHSCLRGVIAYFDKSVAEKTKDELTRHIFALDGDVAQTTIDEGITHHIVDNGTNQNTTDEIIGSVRVGVNWLIRCIREKSKIPEQEFLWNKSTL